MSQNEYMKREGSDLFVVLNDGHATRYFEVIWAFNSEHGKGMPELEEVGREEVEPRVTYGVPTEALV